MWAFSFPFGHGIFYACIPVNVYITHLTHLKISGQVEVASLFKIHIFCILVYLWSLLHQLQLKPIWEDTQGPQPLNWRQARKWERKRERESSRLTGIMEENNPTMTVHSMQLTHPYMPAHAKHHAIIIGKQIRPLNVWIIFSI